VFFYEADNIYGKQMEMDALQQLIAFALTEDIASGDITTDNLISPAVHGQGRIVAKEPMIIAGLDVARQVFEALESDIIWHPCCEDGDEIEAGTVVLEVKGTLRTLLKGERTALNFMQRLSGIATHVRQYVNALDNDKVRLVDTRKTTPGWRTLEKYAVRVGGAYNHRMGLYDGVLIKDNHIAVCGGIKATVAKARQKVSHLVKIEVEASSLAEVEEALETQADVIMLDNMDLEQIRAAVRKIDGRALVEVSGSVVRKDLNRLADTGIDIISSGALTHQARSVDLSMRITR